MLFDIPHLNGQPLRDVPLVQRKAILAELLEKHPHPLLRFSEHQIGNGAAVFAQARSAGFEGIISKRIESGYSSTRNGDWVKIKARLADEFVVVGYTRPKGTRSGIGALLLARKENGRLIYAGRVGTGFDNVQLSDIRKRLARMEVATPPAGHRFDGTQGQESGRLGKTAADRRSILSREVGGQGLLRQVAFKTLRLDKTASDLMLCEQNRTRLKTTSRDVKEIERCPRNVKTAKAKARTKNPLPDDGCDHPRRARDFSGDRNYQRRCR